MEPDYIDNNYTPDGIKFFGEKHLWTDPDALPFVYLTFNGINKLFIGDYGTNHHKIHQGDIRKYMEEHGMEYQWIDLQHRKNRWSHDIEVDGRVWRLIPDANRTPSNVFSFWSIGKEMDAGLVKLVVDMVVKALHIEDQPIYIASGSDVVPYENVGVDIADNGNVYASHLLPPEKKREATSDFRSARDSRLGKKLTMSNGSEMTMAQYRALKQTSENTIKSMDRIQGLQTIVNEAITCVLNETPAKNGDGYYIGFASQFYTLWYITTEHIVGRREEYDLTRFTYICNLSHDLEQAKRNAERRGVEIIAINPELRGTHSWESRSNVKEKLEFSPDKYQFGKWAGQYLSFGDGDYLLWYYDQIINSPYYAENRKEVEKILLDNGYHMVDGRAVSDEVYQSMIQKQTDADNAKQLIDSGEPIDVIAQSNLKDGYPEDFTYCRATLGSEPSDKYIWLHFKEFKEMVYQGFPYYLPVINGKAKRIKNKALRIDSYTYVGDAADGMPAIEVHSFTML
jgi:hypothetical protein